MSFAGYFPKKSALCFFLNREGKPNHLCDALRRLRNVNDLKAFSKPETFIISCKSEKYWQDYRVTGSTL